MMKIQKLLIPYDGSELTENAVIEGIKLAAVFKAKITLLLVIEKHIFSKPYFKNSTTENSKGKNKLQDILQIIKDKSSKVLENKTREINENGIEADYKIELGSPSKMILTFSKNNNIDLIVIGRKNNLKGLAKLKTIGSVSRNVVENTDIPVVMVGQTTTSSDDDKNDDNDDNDNKSRKLKLKKYNNILVPLDVEDSKYFDKTIEMALKFRQSSKNKKGVIETDIKSTLHFMHVVPEIPIPPFAIEEKVKSSKTGQYISVNQYLKELYLTIHDDVQKMIKDKIQKNTTFNKDDLKIIILYGNAASKIKEYSNKENIDLIIMGTNSLKGVSKVTSLGSTARRVAEMAHSPIMIIK